MTSSLFNQIKYTLFTFFIFIFFITIFFTPFINNSILDSTGEFMWPLPDYHEISSFFGYRSSPTAGASTYHSGIDIPAPVGTNIYSVCSGNVTFASWGAGGGYTIVVENNTIAISYCHVSPDYIVFVHDAVQKGQIIAQVGPKNVYGIENNPYHDSNGNPTNGATTGCHLHLTIKKDGNAVDPLDFF